MPNNDRPIGRILSRRKTLALLRGAGTAVLVVSCASNTNRSAQAETSGTAASTAGSSLNPSAHLSAQSPACVISPEQTEGPYFVDERLNRSDIRSDPANAAVQAGIPLQLTIRVVQVGSNRCAPLAGAIVDIWHCNAQGVYSDVTDRSFNTVGQKFLRGYQITNAAGQVQFTTIYPGWYPGRTVHIHFKVRSDAGAGKSYEFTSQLYFDDAMTDRVHAQAPYASRGQRTLKNADDGIFRDGGDRLLLKPTQTAQGYAATFEVGMQMT